MRDKPEKWTVKVPNMKLYLEMYKYNTVLSLFEIFELVKIQDAPIAENQSWLIESIESRNFMKNKGGAN